MVADPRPIVGPTTEQLYRRLPELYRDADEAQAEGASNYPLLRYLSLVGDQLTPIAELLERFTYTPRDDSDGTAWQRFGTGLYGSDTYGDADTADLVDPLLADSAWLPWLAQLLGVNIAGLTLDEQRARIAAPAESWDHGTARAITALARAELVGGTGYVDVLPRYRGEPYRIGLVTKRDETYGATTWRELELLAPTWADLELLGSWSNLEAASLVRAAMAERPAGYVLEHVYLEDVASVPAPPPAPPVNLLGTLGSFETPEDAAAWHWNPVFGTFPEVTTAERIAGDSTDGDYCLEITWPEVDETEGEADGFYVLPPLGGLVPGLTYQVTADVKVPAGSPDVGLVLLFKAGDTWVTTRDQWTTVTSPPWVADSTQLWIGFRTLIPWRAGDTPGGTARIDNVRLTVI